MVWIYVEKSDFADTGQTVRFSDGGFTCTNGVEAGLKLPAADIVFLNRQPKARRVSSGTDTNVFRNAFYMGAVLAFFAEFFKFFDASNTAKPGKKLNTPIIVRFKNEKFLSGKTSFDTFYEIQNAWLDSK